MAAGYLMTKTDLADALPDLATANQGLELRKEWPFWSRLEDMRSADATRLRNSLLPGGSRFFRRQRTWLGRVRNRIPFLRGNG